ncbi:MAG: rhomboid family intramembrane serine protease [Gemmatimonadaceae bacterium]|nr:rhomboid family intramembrane serine protease [Gemmatimonadaceae bacterium]
MSWSPVEERPRITPTVQALIAANVAVLFVQWTLIGDGDTFRWLAYRDGALLSRWWTVGSYMFVHGGLLHLALNMYSLWLFGPRLEAAWGAPRFATLYAWCGLGGVALHALFGGAGFLVGASGAVFGVMLAYALTWPEDEILFFGVIPMRVMTLVMVLGAMNLLQGITYAGSGIAHFAHVGGFLFAFIFLRAPGLFGLDRARQQVADLPDEDARPRAIQRPQRPRERADEVEDIVARSRAALSETTTRVASPRPSARAADPQSEVDRVLDKISASGLDSLSRQERGVLDAYSERLKQGR